MYLLALDHFYKDLVRSNGDLRHSGSFSNLHETIRNINPVPGHHSNVRNDDEGLGVRD